MGKRINQMNDTEKFVTVLGMLTEISVDFEELYQWLLNHQSNQKANPGVLIGNLSTEDLGVFYKKVMKSKFTRDPKPILELLK